MKVTGYSRVSKDLIIARIEKEVKGSPIFFITQYGKISASSLDKLRAKLRLANTSYLVVKNRLGKKSFEKMNLLAFSDKFVGACGIAFAKEDPVSSSKVLVDFAKENESFKVAAGMVNGQILSVEDIKSLASLPSRQVLLGKVVGGIQAPISRFVRVLSGTVSRVVTVLDAIAKKKGGAS